MPVDRLANEIAKEATLNPQPIRMQALISLMPRGLNPIFIEKEKKKRS